MKDHEIESWRDPIVEEVRAARDAYAASLGYDLDRIYDDLVRKATERKQRSRDDMGGVSPRAASH